jgi:hypothetical protein
MTTMNDVFADRRNLDNPQFHERLGEEQALDAAITRDRGSGVSRSMLGERALAHLDDLLDVDLKPILVGAWSRTRELRDYGERSRKDPGKDFLLTLAEHQVHTKHQPYLNVVVNGQTRGRIDFDVDLGLKLKGFRLVIRNGRIVAVTTGTGVATGKVSLDGFVVLEEKSRPVSFPGRLDLDDGVTIP